MGSRKRKFSFIFILCTICMCIFFIFPGEFLYSKIREVHSVLFAGIYFGCFGILMVIALCTAAILEQQKVEPKALAISAFCLILLLLCGMFFEFLYELGGETEKEETEGYIFLIDNSSSMQENDPLQERIESVYRILEKQESDISYAVYSFGAEVGCVREMAPISAGAGQLEITPAGQTPVVTMLKYLQQEFEAGLTDRPETVQVILLTDGYATDNGLFGLKINRTLRYFAKNRIRISTVGLGNADDKMLKKIADYTDGINIMVSDVEQLKEAMQSAAVSRETYRNLLSYRDKVPLNWLYGIMRIFFVTVLGLIIMVEKLVIVNDTDSQGMILVTSVAGSLLAGIMLEAGINLAGLSETAMRIVAMLLIGVTPAYVTKILRTSLYDQEEGYGGYDEYGGYGGSGGMRIN